MRTWWLIFAKNWSTALTVTKSWIELRKLSHARPTTQFMQMANRNPEWPKSFQPSLAAWHPGWAMVCWWKCQMPSVYSMLVLPGSNLWSQTHLSWFAFVSHWAFVQVHNRVTICSNCCRDSSKQIGIKKLFKMTSAQTSMQITVLNSQEWCTRYLKKPRISLTPITLDLTNSQQCRSLSISMQHFHFKLRAFFKARKVRTKSAVVHLRSRHAFGTPWHQAFRLGKKSLHSRFNGRWQVYGRPVHHGNTAGEAEILSTFWLGF